MIGNFIFYALPMFGLMLLHLVASVFVWRRMAGASRVAVLVLVAFLTFTLWYFVARLALFPLAFCSFCFRQGSPQSSSFYLTLGLPVKANTFPSFLLIIAALLLLTLFVAASVQWLRVRARYYLPVAALIIVCVPIGNGYMRVGIDPNGEHLPLPPNAEQIVEEPFWISPPMYKRITFESTDSPQTIVNFYNRAMIERGWELASSPTYKDVYSRITLENRDLYVILDTQVVTSSRTLVTLTPTSYRP